MKTRRILVTSALPYANGSIHLGHILEYIQTDVWVRFQRLRGHRCYYVCADDAHGSAIMLKARSSGLSPEVLIERVRDEHLRDFKDFSISFDNYHSTHSPENRRFSELIYHRLAERGHIKTRTIQQAYDEEAGMFLPDRFIRGECPRCGAADQYGDCCEVCGATYAASELRNPRSALTGNAPVLRESEHLFFDLGHFSDSLKRWLAEGHVQPEIANKLKEWFAAGLAQWDISRDAPYFGFAIPGYRDRFFYVWLDAPIGYMASFQQYCERQGLDFDEYWGADSGAELHHFIGKDIAYFHTLFWPAMLEGSGFRRPTRIHCHGFVTINGQKMSKSRGTFVTARAYLDRFDAEYLRYYFAARLNASVEDIDLNVEDFVARVNCDLVGKLVNIASRCARFIERYFAGSLRTDEAVLRHRIVEAAVQHMDDIASAYESLEYNAAVRAIMNLADQVNRYIDQEKPWQIVRESGISATGEDGGGQSESTDDGAQQAARERLQIVCSVGLVAFAQLMLYLKPALPRLSERVERFLAVSLHAWKRVPFTTPSHTVQPFQPLLHRIKLADVQAMIQPPPATEDEGAADKGATDKGMADEGATDKGTADKRAADKRAADKGAASGNRQGHHESDEGEMMIGMDDFSKVDLRVARIIQAEEVPGADRLLKLSLDFGGERRTVFAGIKAAYRPEQLQERLVVAVANLKPKKMSFGVSEGMALAAGEGSELFLLSVDSGAQPGMKIR